MSARKTATSKPAKPLTEDEKFTYLHRRIARLERNSGMRVHANPLEVDADQLAEDANKAKAEALDAQRRDAENKARIAAEAKQASLHKDADDNAPISVGAADDATTTND